MGQNKARWANIICDSKGRPTKMIVTDGETTSTVDVTNSKVKTCKKTAMDVFDVPSGHILVSTITGDAH